MDVDEISAHVDIQDAAAVLALEDFFGEFQKTVFQRIFYDGAAPDCHRDKGVFKVEAGIPRGMITHGISSILFERYYTTIGTKRQRRFW